MTQNGNLYSTARLLNKGIYSNENIRGFCNQFLEEPHIRLKLPPPPVNQTGHFSDRPPPLGCFDFPIFVWIFAPSVFLGLK